MIKKPFRLITIYSFFILICISFSSCLSVKELKLFQNLSDSTKLANIKLPKFVPPIIKGGDILAVTIVTSDPLFINAANAVVTSNPVGEVGATTGGNGYLVDKDGNILIPVVGKINVLGLTVDAARTLIQTRVAEYFTDPVVVVKSLNLKITILGEVQRPGTYNIGNEKVTIVDALAYSGDFTTYARRDNVLLLRQNLDNTLSSIRIDIKKSEILQSPYYYLQSNDIIYIEPNKGKAYANDVLFTRNISYVSLAIGFLSTFFTTLILIKHSNN